RVFEARDGLTGAAVAVKVLHAHCAAESARFAREAAVLAELSHPGIVRYIAHGLTDERVPYLVMEWLEGETLAERLRRSSVGVVESVAMAARLARALGAVHRA